MQHVDLKFLHVKFQNVDLFVREISKYIPFAHEIAKCTRESNCCVLQNYQYACGPFVCEIEKCGIYKTFLSKILNYVHLAHQIPELRNVDIFVYKIAECEFFTAYIYICVYNS